ncbi:hypothetical protein KO465_01695 [Candidatus Micrarchaeota archaeon]|nr:hypothetical protein [Candidatus Micrarchaeota archaeon]
MSVKKVGYKMPRSMAGVMGSGETETGGIPIDPKWFLIVVLGLIILINIVNLYISYF